MDSPAPDKYLPDNWLAAGRLLRGVTHGMNNHLGAILAYAELIALAPGCSTETASIAKEISSAVRQSSAQLDTLAALVAEEITTVETIHLNEVLPRIAGLFRFEFERAGVSIDLALPDTVCAFPGVRTRIYRVFAHLIRHAAGSAPSAKNPQRVRIHLARAAKGFVIDIESGSRASELPGSLDEARAHIAYHGGEITSPKPGMVRIEIPQDTRLIKA